MASKIFQHRESLNFIIQMLTGWHRCLATTNLFPMPRSSSRIRTTRPTSRTLSSGDSAKRNRPRSQDTKTRAFLAEIFLLSISERARYHLLDKSIICGLFLHFRIQFFFLFLVFEYLILFEMKYEKFLFKRKLIYLCTFVY